MTNSTEFAQKRYIALLFLLSGVLALYMAYYSEYVLNFPPCKLCNYQRIPFFIAIPISALMLCKPKIKFLDLLLVIITLSNVTLAGHHVAVENKWITESSLCGASNADDLSNIDLDSIEALDAYFENKKHVPCDEPSIVVFGVSMAGWNVIYCLMIVLCYLTMRVRFKLNKNAEINKRNKKS